ncbi:MAG: Hsp20/alpha crystallin family protein [Desulfarculus sp.]|nr:Hsp20/alpha crystallin family protein [Desulfarculus sp.]
MERFFGGSLLPVEGKEEDFVPSVYLKETEEGYELTAEVPGLKPEEIEVSLTGDILVLKGEKKEGHEETKGDYHLVWSAP